ncbi:hypothetical protein BKA70DRAFT_876941 [Coprinopsis sp. MPI-PUGE-AT-0042]|nr:hypothetical protein BKA70DRAFT_876941 [Coprinopsis sp. MPI-PUGE-AT-0042]
MCYSFRDILCISEMWVVAFVFPFIMTHAAALASDAPSDILALSFDLLVGIIFTSCSLYTPASSGATTASFLTLFNSSLVGITNLARLLYGKEHIWAPTGGLESGFKVRFYPLLLFLSLVPFFSLHLH